MDSLIYKKGILLTLGMVFVSLTILSFANVILENSETSESRIKEFAETERVYNTRSSISKSMERMKDEIMAGYLDIGYENGIVEFKTKFTGKAVRPEVEIIQQMEIFNDRVKERNYIDFEDDKFPMVDDKGVLIDYKNINVVLSEEDGFELLSQLNVSKFYLKDNPNMYIGYSSWPYNTIYLNGFNHLNTEEINFTFKSQTKYAHASKYTNNVANILTSCGSLPSNCIKFNFNNYYRGELKHTESFNIWVQRLDAAAYPSYLGVMNVPIALPALSSGQGFGHASVFILNISDLDGNKNRTVVFNWVQTSLIDQAFGTPTDKSTSGMLIMLPKLDISGGTGIDSAQGVFNQLFYGLYQISGSGPPFCPSCGNFPPLNSEDVMDIEIQIILKGDYAKHHGGFESAPSYTLNLPFIETGGKNVTIEYSG